MQIGVASFGLLHGILAVRGIAAEIHFRRVRLGGRVFRYATQPNRVRQGGPYETQYMLAVFGTVMAWHIRRRSFSRGIKSGFDGTPCK